VDATRPARPAARRPEVEAAHKAIPISEPARSILRAQRPRGAWANEKHLYSPKHTATHWQLDLLADFGFTATDAPVRRACDLFFAWQLPSGAFGIVKGAASEEPCITGRTLCQFERFTWAMRMGCSEPGRGWKQPNAATEAGIAGTPRCECGPTRQAASSQPSRSYRRAPSGAADLRRCPRGRRRTCGTAC